jgi:predicted transcriptional regulator
MVRAETTPMGPEPGHRTEGYRSRKRVLELESPAERLICMYLDRVPAAYAAEIECDLQLSGEAIASSLASLVEDGYVRNQGGLYALATDIS